MTEIDKIRFQMAAQAALRNYNAEKQMIDADLHKLCVKTNKLPQFVQDADDEFEQFTRISKKDLSFLAFASALQVSRQLVSAHLNTRLSDGESAARTPFHGEEHSDRRTRQYYATKAEIANNPVPFDAMRKSEVVKNNGNPKLSGFDHRYKAIGHDPLLGLVFGTANIMTKTITVAKGNFLFETYHVGSGLASNGSGIYKIDMLTNQASTSLMFEHVCNRLKQEGREGWEALALAVGKELVHLLSDVRTAKSLPLPVVSAVSPDVSRILNLCGIDALSTTTFTTDYLVSKMIDIAIAYMHAWCYNPSTDGPIKAYEARTQNVIYYSNVMSLASTTIQTLCRLYMNDYYSMAKFDFGGALSSLKVIWNTPHVISDMKSEYIRNKTINNLKN